MFEPSLLLPKLYCGDKFNPIRWPEDFPLSGLPRVDTPEQADLFLFPWYWQTFDQPVNPSQLDPSQPRLAEEMARRLRHLEACSHQSGKSILLFRYHDDATPLPHRYSWVWRTSLYASCRRPTEAALPAFHRDVVEEAAALSLPTPKPLQWQLRPCVGFCGQSIPLELPARQRAKSFLRSLLGRPYPYPEGYWLRRAAMRHCLRAEPQLSCRFVLTDPCDPSSPAEQKQRFLANLFDSAYVICGSGYGNYSYRFYEALSAGRIPVLLDTDVQLPFDQHIPWRELIVQVPAALVSYIPQRILEFNGQFTPSSFLKHQLRLRQVWEQFCTQEGFQHTLEQDLRRMWKR